jgi:predicted permease
MKWWWQLKQSESDLERELKSDLDLEEEEQREQGVPAEEASHAARRALGNEALIKEQTREAWGWVPFERSLQDVRFAIRQLSKSRSFTAVCVITLAVGIGATTAIFTVVDSLLFRPLPYPNSARIERIWNTFPPRGMMEIPASEPEFNKYRKNESFSHFAGFSVGAVTITGGADPLRVASAWGTTDFFAVMGTEPLLGRVFSADEQQPGHNQVAILSYRLWQSRFGGDSRIIGKPILLNGQSSTIVGVMPRSFEFPSNDVDIWQPLPIEAASSNLGNHYLNLIGDLKPHTTPEQARSELLTIFNRIEHEYPTYYSGAVGLSVNVIPLRQQIVGDLRPSLLILMAGVGFMLLIACTNVASLLLARGEERKREIATRAALGASRLRILYQVLTETLLLFIASGILALLCAATALKFVSIEDYLHLDNAPAVTLDIRVFLFAIVVSSATGLIFGLVPALKACRVNFSDALKTGGRDAMLGHNSARTRSTLVISEIAFSLVLLTGAGLMVASLANLLGVNLGFNPKDVVTMRLSLPESRYSLSRSAALYQQAQDAVKQLPGIQAVAITNQLPMSDVVPNASFDVEGRASNNDINVANTAIISPDYFRVMGISLIQGRLLTGQDVNLPPASVVVNQTFARRVWLGDDPIGKRIRLRTDAPWLSVVGVVADIKNNGSYLPTKPEMYFAYTDKPFGIWADLRSMTLVVKTPLGPEQVAGEIRDELKHFDSDLPIYKVVTLQEVVSSSLSRTRYPAITLAIFGCAALMLAGIGVYGVLAYTVAQRRHEIGVRMALGAQRNKILWSFVTQGIRWTAIGGCVGVIAALMLVRFMRSVLFEVTPYDPKVFFATAAIISAATLFACTLPGLRATKIDPMGALRNE